MNDQIEMVFDTGHQVKIRLQHVGFQLQLYGAAAGRQLSRCMSMFLLSTQKRKKGLHLRYLVYTP